MPRTCQKHYRIMPMGNRARLIVESKTILKRAGIFIPCGSGKCTQFCSFMATVAFKQRTEKVQATSIS